VQQVLDLTVFCASDHIFVVNIRAVNEYPVFVRTKIFG